MEIRKVLILSFEGKEAITERKYFEYFKIRKDLSIELFNTEIVKFQSRRLEKGTKYNKDIPRLLSGIANIHTYCVYLIIDNDKKEIVELFSKQISDIKSAIIDAMGERCNEEQIQIEYLPLPEGKNFEFFLRMHFENNESNVNDHDFIKGKLGEKYKKANDNYPQKLWNICTSKTLKDNLKKTKCSYQKMFSFKEK
jgi:hypothetical protein